MRGPLDERSLHHDLGLHPVRPDPRQADGFREWGLRDLESIEARTQVEQQLGVESRSDLTREYKLVGLEVSNE